MRWPLLAGTFLFGYHIATFLPAKLFTKLSRKNKGVAHETYTGEIDLVSRFRVFERPAQAEASETEEEILDYLTLHSSDPLTKPMLVEHMTKKLLENVDMSKWRIKRSGKDEDDIYWALGKVHGVENIAYIDDDKL